MVTPKKLKSIIAERPAKKKRSYNNTDLSTISVNLNPRLDVAAIKWLAERYPDEFFPSTRAQAQPPIDWPDNQTVGKLTSKYITTSLDWKKQGCYKMPTHSFEQWSTHNRERDYKFSWEECEGWVCHWFDLTAMTKAERIRDPDSIHWDAWRYLFTDVKQRIEIKLTTGHAVEQPTMLRSSKAQIESLTNTKEGYLNPSLYIVVSLDCFRRKDWYVTIWMLPLLDIDYFRSYNTNQIKSLAPEIPKRDTPLHWT